MSHTTTEVTCNMLSYEIPPVYQDHTLFINISLYYFYSGNFVEKLV